MGEQEAAHEGMIRLIQVEWQRRGKEGDPQVPMALAVWPEPNHPPQIYLGEEECDPLVSCFMRPSDEWAARREKAKQEGRSFEFRPSDLAVLLDVKPQGDLAGKAFAFMVSSGTGWWLKFDLDPLGDQKNRWFPTPRQYRAVKPPKGFLRGPTVLHAHVLTGAMVQTSDKWEFDEERAFLRLPDGSAWIPFQTEEGAKLLNAEVMTTLAALGPEALKLMLACVNYWIEYAPVFAEWHTPVKASLNDLLRYMGYSKWGRSNKEIKDAGRRLFALARICTRSKTIRYEEKRKKEEWDTLCPLLSIESVEFQKTLFDQEGDLSIATDVEFHLGKDWHAWLYGEGSRYGLFNNKLLTYSANNGRLPLLLGWYLTWQFRIRLRHNNPPIHLRTLLEGAYVEWPKRARDYSRFLNRIESALDQLHTDGIIGEWKPLYNKARDSTRQILEKESIQIDPPPDLLEAYQEATDKLIPASA